MDFSTAVFKHIFNNNHEVAVIDSELNKYSYSSLYVEIERIKHGFIKEGLSKGNTIILHVDKTFDTLCHLLACVSMGIIYIPVDIDTPDQRIKNILEISKANAIVNPNLSFNIFHLENNPTPDDASCILYTSGSTGIPKGVVCSSKGMLAFVNWTSNEFNLSNKDTLTSFAPLHFDLSIFDIFSTLTNGATVWLIDSKLSKNLRLLGKYTTEIAPTIWYATPTVFTLLHQYGKIASDYSPRLVLFAGEVFPITNLNKVRQKWNTVYYNLYGPTETNVCTYYRLPKSIELNRSTPYPIGINCPYIKTKVCNSELYVSGDSVMIEYHNNPIETKEKMSFERDTIWFKTGDIVSETNDGYIYKGRIDRMIKRRGFRIELDELEATLCKHEKIEGAAAIVVETSTSNTIIIYYNGIKLSPIDLSIHCNRYLPQYMIPDQFIHIKNMPVSTNGKVNYNQLNHIFNANG